MPPSIDQNLMPVSAMTADTETEASAEMLVNDNMDDGVQEESPSRRKRGSPLKSTTDNKRQRRSKADKKKPFDDATQDKENNGRRPSPNTARADESESVELESGNDFLAGRNINPENKPAEAGVITKIYAENFMW